MPEKSQSQSKGKSKVGHASGGIFKGDPQRASEAGKKGSGRSKGGTHEQHVKAGQQSHKNK